MAVPIRKSSSKRRIRLDGIVWALIVIVGSFYAGMLVGIRSTQSQRNVTHSHEFEQAVKSQVQAVLQKRRQFDQENSHNMDFLQLRFGEATAHFAMGAARVDKQDFVEIFDSGLPADQGNFDPAASEVLLFYNSHNALPDIRKGETISASGIPPKLTAMDATQNCQTLHIVSTKSALQQCVALVPQYESFHVQRWMRIEPDSKLNNKLPLMPVGRGQQANGVNQFGTPSKRAAEVNWQRMQTYIENVSATLDRLRPLLKQVAVDNTVVVMVCNRGQADLLTNFACANKSRGLSLQNILVFCTDQETCDIATELEMSIYYGNEVSALGVICGCNARRMLTTSDGGTTTVDRFSATSPHLKQKSMETRHSSK